LGGHYGMERLVWGARLDLGSTPQEQCFEFPGPDQSLAREWQDFTDCIQQGRTPQSNGRDGYKTLQLAESIYRDASAGGTPHGSPYAMPLSNAEIEPPMLAHAHPTGEHSR
jgi:predicted dehydrogenase